MLILSYQINVNKLCILLILFVKLDLYYLAIFL